MWGKRDRNEIYQWLQTRSGSVFCRYPLGPRPGAKAEKVIFDQEHELGARITLERNTRAAPFAITCGIYGWMVARGSLPRKRPR
jgi:hypothetical protein